MTDPVKEYLGENWRQIYTKTIRQAIEHIQKSRTILLKFHHRDSDDERNIVVNTIVELGMSYNILAPKINIPVEFFLQEYRFERVYVINASTYFYNGILYPRTNFEFLLPLLYQNALEIGIHEDGRKWIERILALQGM